MAFVDETHKPLTQEVAQLPNLRRRQDTDLSDATAGEVNPDGHARTLVVVAHSQLSSLSKLNVLGSDWSGRFPSDEGKTVKGAKKLLIQCFENQRCSYE